MGRAAADGGTLELLLAFGVLPVPAVIGYQAWNWWAFRGRVAARDAGWFGPGRKPGGVEQLDGSGEPVSRSR